MFHPLISCICHVIDFHEHSTRWLGFEYDSFKATFPQRLPEFCQSPMALLTYSDDPWLPGWTRLLGQALPSPPNPAWVLPVLSMTAPENCLPPWSGAGDHHIVISLSFYSTFTSCHDFLSTFEIELVCHLIERERNTKPEFQDTYWNVFFAFVGRSKQDDFEPWCFPVRSEGNQKSNVFQKLWKVGTFNFGSNRLRCWQLPNILTNVSKKCPQKM